MNYVTSSCYNRIESSIELSPLLVTQEGVLFYGMEGWILIHKKILDWEWYSDRNTTSLFLHLLLLASHKEGRWQGMAIVPGQVITSRDHLAQDLNLGVQSIRTSLTKLKSTSEITIKTTNKCTIITILKWSDYQKQTRKLTNHQPTTNQQLTTSKEYKEYKELNTLAAELTETLKYTPESLMAFWNSVALPHGVKVLNPSANKKLLSKCKGLNADIVSAFNALIKKGYQQEDFERAIKNYCNEIINRVPGSSTYYLHRFSFYDFLKQSNGMRKYAND